MKTPIFRRKGYAMKDDTVVALRQPESFSDDPLTEILRAGARQLLGQAIEAEVAAHIEAHCRFDRRFGPEPYCPSRAHAGTRTSDRDRSCDGEAAKSARPRSTGSRAGASVSRHRSCRLISGAPSRSRHFGSGFIRRASPAATARRPWRRCWRPDAAGLTASTIGRLKAVWWDEYEAWQKRDLSARRYVYLRCRRGLLVASHGP